MNKKWKWGLSLASATVLLSGISVSAVACSSKQTNNPNGNQETNDQNSPDDTTASGQLYTPPEEVNIGDGFLYNLYGSDFEVNYLIPSPINKGDLEGSCVFQDDNQNSPTYKGWYNLILDNSDPHNQQIFANFLGYYKLDFPTGPQAQMQFPSEVKIPDSINLIYTKDNRNQKITSVPIAGFNLLFPVRDAEKYISIFPICYLPPINTTVMDFSSNTNLQFINISIDVDPSIDSLKFIFPRKLKLLEGVYIDYQNKTNDLTTTFDFSKCQHSNITKRQKYPQKIEIWFKGLVDHKVQHNNTLNYILPNNTPIYFNSQTYLSYNYKHDQRTKGVININNTENINYFGQKTFHCSDINSLIGNKPQDNTLFLNDNCYYYTSSFLKKTIVRGGIEVNDNGYLVNPQTDNIKPQLQCGIKIDPIK